MKPKWHYIKVTKAFYIRARPKIIINLFILIHTQLVTFYHWMEELDNVFNYHLNIDIDDY